MDRLLSMILNRVLNRLLHRGISAGVKHVTGNQSPEQRAQTTTAREAYRRGRQAAAILRRLR